MHQGFLLYQKYFVLFVQVFFFVRQIVVLTVKARSSLRQNDFRFA
ncbi:hypothetical protein SORDD20_01160 [Streptococcus oralis]|nr:hypothetical protein SORDD20_01160 [Streptococcus oralis]